MLNSSAAVWAAEQPFFILLLLCYPQTWQHLSGVWHSPHQTKHNRPAFILLLNCEGLLTPPSQSLSPHAEGTARSFHYQSALKAARNQRGFVGYLSTVATTTTTSSILPVFVLYTFDHTLRCQPATLPWNRFIAKTLFCGMISILSVQYFTHPSVLYPHRMNTGASAKNSTRVYSCYQHDPSTHHHPTWTTIQTLSPLSRSAKTHCGHPDGQVNSKYLSF